MLCNIRLSFIRPWELLLIIVGLLWLLGIYISITVEIKWKGYLFNHIRLPKGTRQGGLSSPFLLNLFHNYLVESLSAFNGGINIGSMSLNAFSYADDILLCSLTVTGLQEMISTSNEYISNHVYYLIHRRLNELYLVNVILRNVLYRN